MGKGKEVEISNKKKILASSYLTNALNLKVFI